MAPADGDDVTVPPDVLRALGSGGDWISSWTVAVALVAAAVVLVVWMAIRHRRGRRAWPGAVLAVPTVVVGLAIGVNAYVGYIPTTEMLRVTMSSWGIGHAPATEVATAAETEGDQTRGAVHSATVPVPAALKMPTDALTWVYTPPGYDPSGSARYPVLYLVHGSPGKAGDWVSAGNIAHTMDVLIASGQSVPMIVVSADVNGTGPSADDTECLDSTTGGSQVETYLTTVVIPWADATYRTAADAAHRAIGGFSSGAYCALDQGLRHADLYGTVVSIAGYTDPGSGGHAMLATDQEFAAHNIAAYVSGLHGDGRHVFLSIDAKEADGAVLAAQALADPLRAAGFDVATQSLPHFDHAWVYARAAIPYGVVFFSRTLSG